MKGIKSLARHLDISIGTVSRALNGKPDVNEETRKRVLAAAAELGYVANQAGRALRRGATNAIGFMMQTGAEITSEGDVFFMSVFDGVQAVFARHQLDLVALLCSSEEDSNAYLQRMAARSFTDALIISATRRHDPRIEFLASRKIPFIALGRSLSDAGHPWLDLDFETMANAGVDRLVARGHRRIGLFAPLDDLNLGFVLTGACRDALERNGIAFAPDLVFRGHPSERGGHQIAHAIAAMADRPTGFIIASERVTVGFHQGLVEAGLTPGRDIALIGRGGPHARYLRPTLSGYTLSLRDLGVTLAESLLANMPAYAETYPLGVVRKVVPFDFIEGESDAMIVAT